jgi:hypothetical protein
LKRRPPADPRAIAAAVAAASAQRRSLARQEERRTRGMPAEWGISVELTQLATSRTIDITVGNRARVVAARRSDAFGALKASGSLNAGQNTAAQRYCKNGLVAAGVRDGDTWRPEPSPDPANHNVGGRGDAISQVMIDAARDNAEAEKRIGILDVRLLRALAEPTEIRPWRELVEARTGLTERHAQVTIVVHVVENLRLAHDAIDRDAQMSRGERRRSANDNERLT